MPYVHVATKDVMVDLTDDELISEFMRRKNWRKILCEKLADKPLLEDDEAVADLKAIAIKFRDGLPIQDDLSRAAWVHAGVIV